MIKRIVLIVIFEFK